MKDSIQSMVESEMQEIEAKTDQHQSSAERAMDDLRSICARARELEKQLKNVRRRLCCNTKRLCDSLDAEGYGR